MAAAAPAARELRTIQRRAMWALASREMRRVLTLWTQTILPPLLTGVIFLAVFGGALGDRLQVADIDYLRFILPGLLVMTVVAAAFSNNSTSLFQAKSEGYIEDVLSSPMHPWQLVVGYMAGGLLRAWLATLVLWLLAWPFAGAVENPAVTLAALVLCGLIFAVLGVITGMWADTFDQHSLIANVLITPLAMLGAVFYSVDQLPEPWETLTYFNPIFYLVDATRYGYTGLQDSSAWAALTVAALVAAGVFLLAVTLLRLGWRLKA